MTSFKKNDSDRLVGISFGKIFKFFFTMFIFSIVIYLFFFSIKENNPYNKTFKENWNNIYITQGIKGLEQYISKNELNIKQAPTKKECPHIGFYNEAGFLMFCKEGNIYLFKVDKSIELLNNKSVTLLTGIIYSFLITLFYVFVLLIFHPKRFLEAKGNIGIDEGHSAVISIDKSIREKISKGDFKQLPRLSNDLFNQGIMLLSQAPEMGVTLNIIYSKLLSEIKHMDKGLYNKILLDYLEIKNYYYHKNRDYKDWLLSEINLLFSKNGNSFLIYLINIIFIIFYIALINSYLFDDYNTIYESIDKTYTLILGQNNTFLIDTLFKTIYISFLYLIGIVIKMYMIVIFLRKV